ncbi:MAG: NAD(P)/FAD-dependent oxidoreductase, partial [Myxococcota bacterium]
MDCIVVGGGSAGAMAALELARRGLDVLLLEKRARGKSGARWIDDVERGLLDELGLDTPAPGVVAHQPGRFVMTTVSGSPRHVLDPHLVVGLDMPSLCSRLLEMAEEAGATLRFETTGRIGRYTGTSREVHIGEEILRSPVVVDARGLDLAEAIASGRLHRMLDVCDAYQAVFAVSDPTGASAFMEEERIGGEDVFSTAGVEGGYSVLHVTISESRERVGVLGGSQPFPGRRSGKRIVEDFVAAHAWVGERLSGGGGLIPLRPPRPSLVEDGLVRVGDSAGQVFPTTGSGVALHLRAAKAAARVVEDVLEAGWPATAERLWPYDRDYQRGPGAVCAAYQPMRYVIASLSGEETRLLLEAQVVGPNNLRAAYENRLFS